MDKVEAIKILKDFHDESAIFSVRTALETLHPELKKSEDERIRKELIGYIVKEVGLYPGEDRKEHKWLRWLEKQGGQKPIDKIQLGKKYKCIASPRYSTFRRGNIYKPVDNFLCNLMNLCYECFEPIEDSEQKPADKVEPKFKVGDRITKNSKKSCPVHSSTDDTICEVAEVHDTCYILNTKEGRIQVPFEWQDHYELVGQKPAWSKEDEIMIANIRDDLFCYQTEVRDEDRQLAEDIEKEINWLKLLKERYTWKPSDDDINLLEKVEQALLGKDCHNRLVDFMWKLKKLKGE